MCVCTYIQYVHLCMYMSTVCTFVYVFYAHRQWSLLDWCIDGCVILLDTELCSVCKQQLTMGNITYC